MELRYLKTLIPEHNMLGHKTGKYSNLRKGVVLQYKDKDGWKPIEQVTEVLE